MSRLCALSGGEASMNFATCGDVSEATPQFAHEVEGIAASRVDLERGRVSDGSQRELGAGLEDDVRRPRRILGSKFDGGGIA